MADLLYDYWIYYSRTALYLWRTMGPREYGLLLTSVGVFGWFLMKGSKR